MYPLFNSSIFIAGYIPTTYDSFFTGKTTMCLHVIMNPSPIIGCGLSSYSF
jgi:hypothetical protein